MSYYFYNSESDFCYNLKGIEKKIKDENVKSKFVFKAIREKNSPYFFCKHFQTCGEKGNCGRICEAYQPRNGKSGVCKHFGYTYEKGNKIEIKL
jgi:hypothetical protein